MLEALEILWSRQPGAGAAELAALLEGLRERDEGVYAAAAGDLGWDACRRVAEHLSQCLAQRTPLEDLLNRGS